MEQIVISAKNLGALALQSFCPRCFWLKMRCENKLPYQIFPGIFSSIDSYTKKVTNLHHQKLSVIPKWLNEFGDLESPVKVPHYKKFFVVDQDTNVKLWGAPDEIIQKKINHLQSWTIRQRSTLAHKIICFPCMKFSLIHTHTSVYVAISIQFQLFA